MIYTEIMTNAFGMHYIGKHQVFTTVQVASVLFMIYEFLRFLAFHFYMTLEHEQHLNNQLQTLISSIEETLFQIDSDLKISYVSKEFQGIKPENYLNRSIKEFEFIHKDLNVEPSDLKKITWNWNSSDRYYSFKASPLIENEKLASILLVCLDVTDLMIRKENEIKLLKAETSLKSKIEFIASISHEIRNPLQAALYSIDNLNETTLDSSQKDIIQDIKSSNQLASNIIGDILDISKIEAGKMKVNFEKMNLLQVCERCIENNYPESKKKRLELFLTFSPSLPIEFECDQLRIIQILNNFITNAIKYSHKGSIILDLKMIENLETKYLQFSVKDEGIGMNKQDLERIFTPFEQFGKKSISKGWGLGLSICKTLIEMLNGKIFVESEIDQGSTFSIQVPIINPSSQKIVEKLDVNIEKIFISHPNKHVQDFLVNISKNLGIENIFTQVNSCDNDFSIIHHTLMNKNFENNLPKQSIVIIGEDNSTKEFQTIKEPLKIKDFLQIFKPNSITKEEKTKTHSKSNKKILVCEDNKTIHKSLIKILNNQGYCNITSAYNGLEALGLIKQGHEYDLILMDVQMPEMDGITSTSHIRKFHQENNIRDPLIFICSGNTFPSGMECLYKEYKINEIMMKPISKDVLIETMSKHLKE